MCTPFRATHQAIARTEPEEVLVVGFVTTSAHLGACAVFIHPKTATLGYAPLHEFSKCEVVPTIQFAGH